MSYSEAFKSKVVRKLTGPSAITANALAREIGVPQSTLSRWVRQAGSLSAMSDEKKPKKEKSPNQWTSMEKLRAVVEA